MQKNDSNIMNYLHDNRLYACSFMSDLYSCKIQVIRRWNNSLSITFLILNSLILYDHFIYFISQKHVMKFELSLDQEELNEIQKKETVWFLTEQLVIKRQRFIEVWKMMDYYTREYDKLLREIDYLTNKIKKKHEW